MRRKEGVGGSAWLTVRKQAGDRLYSHRLRAGPSPRKPMPLPEFGQRIAAILGVSPAYDSSRLSEWERGLDDFEAVILIAAETVAKEAHDPRPGPAT